MLLAPEFSRLLINLGRRKVLAILRNERCSEAIFGKGQNAKRKAQVRFLHFDQITRPNSASRLDRIVSVNPSPLGPILDRRSIYIGATAVWASA